MFRTVVQLDQTSQNELHSIAILYKTHHDYINYTVSDESK